MFLVPGRDYLLTVGLIATAEGGALADYSNTGELQEVIVPAGYTLTIDGVPLRQEGLRYVLSDAAPTTAVALNASPNPSNAGQDITLNASVTGNSPTGTIQFLDGAASLGSPVPLSGAGTASLVTSVLSVGNHNLTAAYSGDANNLAATSPATTQTVNAISTGTTAQTITFATLPLKTLGDAPFNLSASASSGLPVTFTAQTTGICTIAASTVSLVATGVCTVRASQAGNGTFAAAANVDQSFTVNPAASSTSGGGRLHHG